MSPPLSPVTSPLTHALDPRDVDAIAERMRARLVAARTVRAFSRRAADLRRRRFDVERVAVERDARRRLSQGIRAFASNVCDGRAFVVAARLALVWARFRDPELGPFATWRRAIVAASETKTFAAHAIRAWRDATRDARDERRERRDTWRADRFRDARALLARLVAWRVVVRSSAGARRDASLRGDAFRAFRALAAHRKIVRARIAARESNRREKEMGSLSTLVVRAWRAWRGRATVGRAAARMRRRAYARFATTVTTAWRAVALKSTRDVLLAEIRAEAHAERRVARRAWRAWSRRGTGFAKDGSKDGSKAKEEKRREGREGSSDSGRSPPPSPPPPRGPSRSAVQTQTSPSLAAARERRPSTSNDSTVVPTDANVPTDASRSRRRGSAAGRADGAGGRGRRRDAGSERSETPPELAVRVIAERREWTRKNEG